ncbi:PTS sugar transporter subunit IIB [Traorella massiliensis]|mgnify:CR=1 FL=1|uniref:PTS sugar transporter subunit IIB n=1 Tax=Traorella massiliensis TaxID=1903263 RepID=UPI0008F8C05B|nr:PTS sugar transporter subunit IIB [Traorella massiliensis]
MYNIILVCEHGASTGMLTTRMQDAAKKLGVEATINAYPYTKLDELIDGADIVLLGPQVRFKKKTFEEKYADKGIEFMVVDTVDYGMMNGEKVLKTVLEHLKK